MIFQNKTLLKGGGASSVGLPLWLHLHILQESSTTNEFVSYFREPGRSALPFSTLPTTSLASERDSDRIKKPSYSRVLGAQLNFSPGLTFTTPNPAATTATAAASVACRRCEPLLPPSFCLSLFCTRMEEEECGND